MRRRQRTAASPPSDAITPRRLPVASAPLARRGVPIVTYTTSGSKPTPGGTRAAGILCMAQRRDLRFAAVITTASNTVIRAGPGQLRRQDPQRRAHNRDRKVRPRQRDRRRHRRRGGGVARSTNVLRVATVTTEGSRTYRNAKLDRALTALLD